VEPARWFRIAAIIRFKSGTELVKTILTGPGHRHPPTVCNAGEASNSSPRILPLKPAEQDLYRRILLDGKIKGRYLGMVAKTDAL